MPRFRASFNPERKPVQVDIDIADRLLNAWHRATREYPRAAVRAADDLWDGISDDYHGDLIEILQSRSPEHLADYLCNMSRHGATVGITQGSTEFRRAVASRYLRDWGGLFILDRLVTLAEMVGVLRTENPEQGRWGENIYTDVDELIDRLNSALGVEVIVPEVEGCLFGLESKSGRIHFRDITALYAALRLRAITGQQKEASVCEIGAGVGRVAYYCARFGIEKYVIYDLPLVNVLQGYFLIRTLPNAKIVLYGEEMPADGRGIRILPGWALEASPSKTFDVVLNQDSFPEIDRSVVERYLREIRRTTRKYFLSINHEAETSAGASTFRHLVVGDVVQEIGGLDRIYRVPCWVRPGYVEELYRCSQ